MTNLPVLRQGFVMSRAATVVLVLLVAVAAATTLIIQSYYAEITAARAAASGGGRVVQTAAGPIEYAERGAGIPLLSIHGAGGGYDQGLVNVGDLVGDGFRVIAPSRFGYLGTPIPSDASPAAQADAHGALLGALKVDRAIVIGFSAGTRSALEPRFAAGPGGGADPLVPATYSPNDPVGGRQPRQQFISAGEHRCRFHLVGRREDRAIAADRFIGVRPELVCVAAR
jgi:hypothetical protein